MQKEFFSNEYIDKSTPTDPILTKLCELTGAKMYGDYIVLDDIENILLTGDIVRILYTNWLSKDSDDTRTLEEYLESKSHTGIACNKDFETYLIFAGYDKYSGDNYITRSIHEGKHGRKRITGNIFQEYSKFLRQEENKWEEVKELINL